ncbi:epidermal retinol dehydrogenase 2-like [Ptychodera flava]|uniref:epidermal retinol dehydrogenase 2-like n=1 Tax=Ptychodera flava TaxID=63121 RepID=UPI003969E38F
MAGLLRQLYAHIGALVITIWACIKFFLPSAKKSVANDIVLVTGAGNGIGRLIAINFAKLGAELVLWDIDKAGMEETAEMIAAVGGTAHCYECDVRKRDIVYGVSENVKEEVGDVSILVNNAGVVAGKRLLDCPDELIERTVDVNTMAIFWTVKAFLPSMIANNHGHLVTIASMAGSLAAVGLVEYCASKFAAVGLHESLMLELIAQNVDGVHTTLVQPTKINTGMFDGMKDLDGIPTLEPQYVADKVVEAVLTNQKQLCLPRIVYLFPFIKSWMPVDAMIHIAKYSDGLYLMDSFVGRQQKDS